MSETDHGKQCVGRFEFSVRLGLIVSDRAQSIYDVALSTVPLPAGGFQALWNDHLKRIGALTPPDGVAQPIERTVNLEPNLHGVWYFANQSTPNYRTLEAMSPVGDHAAMAVRSGESGKESIVEQLVTNLLKAYVPGTARGFCIGAGAVVSAPGSESARIVFEDGDVEGFEIKFDTQSVGRPDVHTYSDLDEENDVVAASGGQLKVLRNHTRSAAQLDGREIWISVVPPGETPFVRFTWHFAGIPGSSSQPAINLMGTAPTVQEPELEKVWETFLQSLHQIPK